MSFVALSSVKHRVRIGQPLPFGVLDANGQLLLTRGYLIDTDDRLTALCNRGSLVLLQEVEKDVAGASDRAVLRAADRIEAWASCTSRLGSVLAESQQPSFKGALDEAATPVLDLIARDPDFAILQAMRVERGAKVQYALRHALHTAITSRLVSERLGWDVSAMVSTFKAALTMNVSMMELQGELAASRTPPSADQRRQIYEHPVRSREMLEAGGITDGDWLRAVEQHHERTDGSGYPLGCSDIDEKARLIRLADAYCAKLGARASRQAMTPDRVARELFVREAANPMTHALVKEFGLYPPGSFVRLASGETGIVVRRGPTMLTPVVAALTWRSGEPRTEPLRRDTSQSAFKVLQAVGSDDVRVSVPLEALVAVH
jgi:HD-GYP domain-containing protein (c-di-GMP phosphodiesterase class II)